MNQTDTIFRTAVDLLNQLMLGKGGLFQKGSCIRLIGVSATNLDHGMYRQMNLFELNGIQSGVSKEKKMPPQADGKQVRSPEKERKLDEMTDRIRGEFGKSALIRASELEKKNRKEKDKD